MYYKGFYIREGNVGYDKNKIRYYVQENHMVYGYLFVTNTLEEAKQIIDDNIDVIK